MKHLGGRETFKQSGIEIFFHSIGICNPGSRDFFSSSAGIFF
jgi:hypothetical protein